MRKVLIAVGVVALVAVALIGAGMWYVVKTSPPPGGPAVPPTVTGTVSRNAGASAPEAIAPPAAPTIEPEAASPAAGQLSPLVPDSQNWPVCSTRCGRERWLVKTLDDPARDQVDMTRIVDATVTQLASLNTATATLVNGSRRAPIETTVYRVNALLVGVLNESDHDYHLILADPNNQQATMIAEIPDPGCEAACASGFASRYARARQLVDQHFSSRTALVRVTGVGFIDFNHGQTGAAPNQVELHPVLTIEYP